MRNDRFPFTNASYGDTRVRARVWLLTVFRRSCSATLILEVRLRKQSATDGRCGHPSSCEPTDWPSVCLSISACASTYQPDGSFLSLLSEQQDNMKPFLSLTPPNIKQTLPLKQTRPTRSSDDIRQTFCRHQVGSSSTPE